MAVVFDAIVLAGGAGSRLGGRDKAAVELHGQPLISAALQAARKARTLVVVGDTSAPLPARAIRTHEPVPGTGPAAGLVAGVRALRDPSDWIALLACDLPGAAAALPRLLQAAGTSDADAVLRADDQGRPQWVLGLYRRAPLLSAIEAFGDPANRSLRALLGQLDIAPIDAADRNWRDVDTWEDHREWASQLRTETDEPTSGGEDG